MTDEYDWEKVWEKPAAYDWNEIDKHLSRPTKFDDLFAKSEPPAGTIPPVTVNGASAYGKKALDQELAILAGTTEGSRNHQLFKSAAALAELVAASHLPDQTTRQELYRTAINIGLTPSETRSTIASGFAAGLQQPRVVPELKPKIHSAWAEVDGQYVNTDTGEIVTSKAEVVTPQATAPTEPMSLILPESFYQSRPVLQRIRDYAHSRGAAADMVLYGNLSRIAGMVPHQCRLQTGYGPAKGASLNQFVAAIGPSSAGKSTGAGVSRDMYTPSPLLDFIDGAPLGSGEGLAEAYMGHVWREIAGTEVQRGPRKGQPRLEKVREQVRHNAFYFADEGQIFTKLQERNGSTLSVVIRDAWYGGTLGNTNADADRSRIIPEGSYSMGMFIGFQPETAQPLLADSAAGTPQRFVYCSAIDPTIPTTRPSGGTVQPLVFQVQPRMLHTPDEIANQVWDHQVGKRTGKINVPELDGHGMLTRLKLAALLALLDGRYEISTSTLDEIGDWELAEIMWQTSCKVRDHYIAIAQQHAARERHTRNLHHADREEMAEARRQQVRDASTKATRVARLVAKYVHDPANPARTVGDLNRRLKSDSRACLPEALEYATSEGWVEVDGTDVTPGPSQPAEGR